METKYGIPASPGIAIGPALVLDTEGVRIPRRHVPAEQLEHEIERLGEAIDLATEDARRSQKEMTTRLGKDIGQIFASHALLLSDPAMRYDIATLIRAESYSAEYAVSRHIRSRVKSLVDSGNELAVRMKADFIDVEKKLLNQLHGHDTTFETGTDRSIIIAHDLTPSETALFDKESVIAFATESGGPTSHTAIMAGALNIPAVVGIGRLISDVSGGDTIIIDGDEGIVILDPDERTLTRYEELSRNKRNAVDLYETLKDVEPITKDGVSVRLMGNIEFPTEAVACLEKGASGVGLYRTEFLYLNKTHDPTEEEHYEAYCEVLRIIGPNQPVVIRTLDLGADKFSPVTANTLHEKNPFLGLRSVRLCLQNRPLFKTQLRAILRASVFGDLRIMFPMISTVLELRQCVSLLREVEEDLADAGIDYKPNLAIGTMIEVPSAALMADVLAKQVKFFSIGTNDLVQYTLAADRNNETVANIYSPVDPAVLRLMQRVSEVGNRQGIEVNVCGEMSGEPLYTALLLGLGIRQLSATPRKIPELKHVIRNLTIPEAEQVAHDSLQMETAREVTSYLRGHLRRFLPSVVD